MDAPSYWKFGDGNVRVRLYDGRQGQAQALDLATNFLTNGYLPPDVASTSQSQGRVVDPILAQQIFRSASGDVGRIQQGDQQTRTSLRASDPLTKFLNPLRSSRCLLYTSRWSGSKGQACEVCRAFSREGWDCTHTHRFLVPSLAYAFERVERRRVSA